jgi:aminopeptidase N
MKTHIVWILIALLSVSVDAQHCSHKGHFSPRSTSVATASDTFDIIRTDLFFDFTNFSSSQLDAHADLQVVALQSGLSHIYFDLLGLQVDSVFVSGNSSTFSLQGEKLEVALPGGINAGDTLYIEVHYGGSPTIDNSGWGGFYFSGGIAYNLGVGFDADPHNYGRTWHPCFDNFVERSLYTFHIRTQTNHFAQANGLLIDSTHTPNYIDHTWEMNQTLPSYLAGIAVGPYAVVEDVYSDMTGRVLPVYLTGQVGDTANLRQSFVHLPDAMACFEQSFGPYWWDKIGYVLTGQGAMEHATNVAYPRFLANGNLQYENIMAHELAHHWWGDLVTCETAGDMWINEGMAEYCSHLFFEYTYDYETYLNRVKENHYEVLLSAHIEDNGFRAIYGIPQSYTYGDHVYYKGAMVVHNLRGYLGDSLFFAGLSELLDSHHYEHINTADFEAELSNNTGVNLQPFFQNHILDPGFATFTVDSFSVQPTTGNYNVEVFIAQRLRKAPQWFTDVPMTVTMVDEHGNTYSEKHIVSGANSTVQLSSPINPVFVAMNMDGDLNMATTDRSEMVSSTGPIGSNPLWITADVDQVSDSTFVYLAHHWGAPGGTHPYNFDVRLSTSHYWEVRYSDSSAIDVSGFFKYDGRNAGGLLDEDLVGTTEDSLVLMYRENAGDDWEIYSHYTKNIIVVSTNAIGRMEFDRLEAGEYVLANIDPDLIGVEEEQLSLSVYPNPTSQFFQIEGLATGNYYVELVDIQGSVVWSQTLDGHARKIDVSELPAGTYLIAVESDTGARWSTTLVVQ